MAKGESDNGKRKQKDRPKKDKGSYHHMLDLVASSHFETIISDLLEGTSARLADPDCRHPKGRRKKKDWTEARIEDFLRKNSVSTLPNGLDRKWWIPYKGNRPTWDLLCHIEVEKKPGLLIVEAKARVKELSENDSKAAPDLKNPRSRANDYSVRLRLCEASLALTDLDLGRFRLSADDHYQLSNRLAYLHKLASEGVPTVLMYLGWLKSPDWPVDPLQDTNHWETIVRDHMQAIAPWAFVGRSHEVERGASMQMVVRSLSVSSLIEEVAQP